MNDLQKDKLQIILNDEILMQTLKEVFELVVDMNKPIITDESDDNLIGQKYRAHEIAKDMIDDAFLHLDSYKVGQKVKKQFNKAR